MSVPGKYDDICDMARKAAGGRACMLLVFEGRRGSGSSVQIDGSANMQSMLQTLPAILRKVADEIESEGTTRH